jgi:hypothetical protein
MRYSLIAIMMLMAWCTAPAMAQDEATQPNRLKAAGTCVPPFRIRWAR